MTKKRKAKLPSSRFVSTKPSTHQPSKAELEEKHDMPGMSDRQIRDAFFRPLKAAKKG